MRRVTTQSKNLNVNQWPQFFLFVAKNKRSSYIELRVVELNKQTLIFLVPAMIGALSIVVYVTVAVTTTDEYLKYALTAPMSIAVFMWWDVLIVMLSFVLARVVAHVQDDDDS